MDFFYYAIRIHIFIFLMNPSTAKICYIDSTLYDMFLIIRFDPQIYMTWNFTNL